MEATSELSEPPLVTDTTPPQDEDAEGMPDMEAVLQRLLDVPASPEPQIPDDLNTDTSEDDKCESVLRTLHRINLLCLEPADLMIVPVCFGDAAESFDALVDSGAEVNLISSDVVESLNLEAGPTSIVCKGLGLSKHATIGEIT